MIELEILGTIRGHTTIFIEDVEPEKRAELAETVQRLLKEGHVLFLIQGEDSRRIHGYDPENNQWIVQADAQQTPLQVTEADGRPTPTVRRRKTRVSARGSRTMAVAPTRGG